MPITATDRHFHLHNTSLSYILSVTELGYLALWHFGPRVSDAHVESQVSHNPLAWATIVDPKLSSFTLERLPQPLGFGGRGDFRTTSLEVRTASGSQVLDLRYKRHVVQAGKPKLVGLPHAYAEVDSEAETLTVTLSDVTGSIEVDCCFSIFANYPVVTQSFCIRNTSNAPISLEKALSASLDLYGTRQELVTLCGGWARERHVERAPLRQGVQSIGSTRGNSSHQYNPFIALCEEGTTEEHGRATGISLVYSGNFQASVELDTNLTVRAMIGIHPDAFSWQLKPGTAFQTPEALLTFSETGLGGLSQGLHRVLRERVCRGYYRDRDRPVVMNSWEALYFTFDAEKVVELAHDAKAVGAEVLVLDDGWFGKRDNDLSGLGDWVVNENKLKGGLSLLIQRVREAGVEFGLWFEPEMVSPDSDLYRAHPDWCLATDGYDRTQVRHQLVLDLGREDVQAYLIEALSAVLGSAPVRYVKWDMNRNQTEPGSALLKDGRQGEAQHRYILGLYAVLEALTQRFPEVLFEGCAGGGGRFDSGLLYYMPQHWTSDNTDARERTLIQYGTSFAYPAISMCAHISASPNHQMGRNTPVKTRAIVAGSANLGLSLSPNRLTPEELAVIKEQIAEYKLRRHLVQFGTFHRLLDPFCGNAGAWMFVSEDRREVFVAYSQTLSATNRAEPIVRLRDLNPNLTYTEAKTGQKFGGDALMALGLLVPQPHPQGDFPAASWFLTAE